MPDPHAALVEEGVAVIPQAMPRSVLRAYRQGAPALFRAMDERWNAGIRQGVESPVFCDLEDLSSLPALADFAAAASPSLVSGAIRHSHRLTEARVRFVAPYPLGYLNWHLDHRDGTGLVYKLVIYLDDVHPGEGEFCYVPGSHLRDARGTEESEARRHGYRRYPGRAGSAIAFDTQGIHAPFANTGRRPRQTLILTFARW